MCSVQICISLVKWRFRTHDRVKLTCNWWGGSMIVRVIEHHGFSPYIIITETPVLDNFMLIFRNYSYYVQWIAKILWNTWDKENTMQRSFNCPKWSFWDSFDSYIHVSSKYILFSYIYTRKIKSWRYWNTSIVTYN